MAALPRWICSQVMAVIREQTEMAKQTGRIPDYTGILKSHISALCIRHSTRWMWNRWRFHLSYSRSSSRKALFMCSLPLSLHQVYAALHPKHIQATGVQRSTRLIPPVNSQPQPTQVEKFIHAGATTVKSTISMHHWPRSKQQQSGNKNKGNGKHHLCIAFNGNSNSAR